MAAQRAEEVAAAQWRWVRSPQKQPTARKTSKRVVRQRLHVGNYRNSFSAASIEAGSVFVAWPSVFRYATSSGAMGARNCIRWPVRGCANAIRAAWRKFLPSGGSSSRRFAPGAARRTACRPPRAAERRKMHANLMRAARVQVRFDQRKAIQAQTQPSNRCALRGLRGGAPSCAPGGADRARRAVRCVPFSPFIFPCSSAT